jgi:hypothetical protein
MEDKLITLSSIMLVGDTFITEAKTKATIKAIELSPYCTLIELRKNDNVEIIVFETEIELPQYKKKDILRIERIAIIYTIGDDIAPEVLSLRSNFPSDIPHLNLRDNAYPKSLCIYEQQYSELRVNWNAAKFIEDIRQWMSATALNNLHQDTQVLEPLLQNDNGTIMYFPGAWNLQRLYVTQLSITKDGKEILLALPFGIPNTQAAFTTILLIGQPQLHGVISHTPKNIGHLQHFLSKANIEVFRCVIEKIRSVVNEDKSQLNNRLLFLVSLPKKRNESDTKYEYEAYSFSTKQSIKSIGLKTGLLGSLGEVVEPLIGAEANLEILGSEEIVLYRANVTLTAELARAVNGIANYPEKEIHLCAIGVGALGSHVFFNCAKSGYGTWLLIDNDILLPHNCARHVLGNEGLGLNKATSLSLKANALLNNPHFSLAFEESILQIETDNTLLAAMNESDIILDMSASVSVGRFLANNNKITKRVISIYLNPSGTDLVILSENLSKTILIDEVETVYYRHLISEIALADHLYIEPKKLRYSTSCRDITSEIAQDNISIYAGISSKEIKSLDVNAEVRIWTILADSKIQNYRYVVTPFAKMKIGEWQIFYDNYIINKLNSFRESKLPKETGGLLLGTYDTQYKKVYIVDIIGSPKDSIEYPTAYIRGIDNVEELLSLVEKRTAGMVQYIGEWHSHPDGCSLDPSEDDLKLFEWLSENMAKDGNPSLMLIKGANSDLSVLFEPY